MRRAWCLIIAFVATFAALGMAQVSIITPRDGETVRSRWLIVKVEKPTQEGHVMIWLDGKFITAITHPFEFRIDLDEQKIFSGTHTLKVAGFNKVGQKEGEAQVQFQVNLIGAEAEKVHLVLKPRTGEISFYTLRVASEATIDIQAKAIRQKVPQLSKKLVIQWFQVVRDITSDRQYRMMRVVEEGLLESEVASNMGGIGRGMAVGSPMSGTGGVGAIGMPGGETGEIGFGILGQMGMLPTPAGSTTPGVPFTSTSTGPSRIRLRPTDDQRVALFLLFPNGNVAAEEMPNVVKFASGSVDISVPERELKIGERWKGFITLPPNLENLTIIGAAMTGAGIGGMPMMGGAPGEEYSGAPGIPGMMGRPMGGPMMPGGPAIGMPGRPGMPGAPMMPGMPMQPGAPAMSGEVQESEASLADAPTITIPVIHRFDGFEFWNDQLCARIVSEFKDVDVELNLVPPTMGGQAGPSGMYGGPPGGPEAMAGQTMPGGPMRPGASTGMSGASMGPGGQPSQQNLIKLAGKVEGSRTLLFDIENGRIVYVKVTMKATFNTDYQTVSQFLQPPPSAGGPGAPGGPTTPGGMMGGVPGGMWGGPTGGVGMPGGIGFGPGGTWGGQPMGGFGGMPSGVGFGPGGMWGGPMSGPGVPGGEGGFYGGMPFGGLYGGIGGGASTTPTPFGRFGTGTFGPTTPGGFGMPGAPGVPGTPGMQGMPQQPTFLNYPAKLIYTLNLENSLTHSGRLDQQLKILGEAR